MTATTIAAFYHFARLPEFRDWKTPLYACCQSNAITGTLLLAQEGINGTIAGPSAGIEAVIAFVRAMPGMEKLEYKLSYAPQTPFLRLKIKLKNEIVTMGVPQVDPLVDRGHYVEPKDWNALIADPEVIVIDTRNDYEFAIGRFERATDPDTQSFRQFPDYVQHNLLDAKERKLALYCTGGIRCEKATNYLLQQGFQNVYHLHGGILKYLEEVPQQDSLWEGGCFVFDQRVALGHGLDIIDTQLCHGCRAPLREADLLSDVYEEGVSCPHCAERTSKAQKAAARERHRQVLAAQASGKSHLGPFAHLSEG